MEVTIGKSYLTVPHEGGKRSFQHPAFKGFYWDVASELDKEGLQRPTSPETASLVYDAFQNLKGKYESEIKDILRSNWLWEFTGNLYLPKSDEEVNNGVIIESNPKITGRLAMDKQSLTKRLQDSDPLVKFVPFGFKVGEQTALDLSKNDYIIARYGKEGADKIAEVASKYKKNPFLNVPNSVSEEAQRMSALGGDWGFGGRLGVVGDGWSGGYGGRVFGVLNSEKSK